MPPKDATPQNFTEETFTNSNKTSKFAKVFYLKSFPLYSIACVCCMYIHIVAGTVQPWSDHLFSWLGQLGAIGIKFVLCAFSFPAQFDWLSGKSTQKSWIDYNAASCLKLKFNECFLTDKRRSKKFCHILLQASDVTYRKNQLVTWPFSSNPDSYHPRKKAREQGYSHS